MVDETSEVEELETEEQDTAVESDAAPADDLRAQLEAAYKEAAAEPAADSEDKPAETGRERDERGRFARKVSDQPTQVEQSEAPKEEPIAPPYSWSAERKELFAQLPRNLQEYIAEREQQRESLLGRKSQEEKQIRERYAPVDRIVTQYGELFRRANVDPYQGLEHLVLAQQYLDKDPVGALRLMAQSYGVDLSTLAAASDASPAPQAQPTPQLHYLTSQLQTIQQQLAAIEQEKMAQQQRYAVSEVEAFASELDNAGKPIRPFMADVHEQMIDEIKLLKARNPEMPSRQVLQQAYETACWKNPSVRARLIEQERQPAIQSARVQQAKLAGASIKGAPGAGALSASAGNSVREALMAAFEQHS